MLFSYYGEAVPLSVHVQQYFSLVYMILIDEYVTYDSLVKPRAKVTKWNSIAFQLNRLFTTNSSSTNEARLFIMQVLSAQMLLFVPNSLRLDTIRLLQYCP